MMINFDDFVKIDFRVGTIVKVRDFPKAKNPAYILLLDFGPLGIKKSSAQITEGYRKEELLGRQVIAVVNFPSKQIAHLQSACLVLGAVKNNKVVLLSPEFSVPNGSVVS